MKKLRLGLWGARCDNTGLGNQTWEFYRNMKPDKTVGIYIQGMGPFTKTYPERYGSEVLFTPVIDERLMRDFLKDLDVVYCAETPYKYDLFSIAREMGVKTVLHYNHEFLDYIPGRELSMINPSRSDVFPDVLLAPSKWHIKRVEEAMEGICKVEYLPFPVSRERLPARNFRKIEKFVHVAGKPAMEDRDGTRLLKEAIGLLKTSPDIIVYLQKDYDYGYWPDNVDLRVDEVVDYWKMWEEGEVIILPRRYGGQSLKLNEAMSTGMIPIMPNIGPQNTFLHPMSLTPTNGRRILDNGTGHVDCFDIDPKALAEHIDIFASMNDNEVSELNAWSVAYGTLISWENIGPKFERLFESLIN